MSTTIERTVTTTSTPEEVFPHLAAVRNATEWPAGTDSCEQVSGEGGPGTVDMNVSTFAGNTVELEYMVDAVEPHRFVIVGRNDGTTSQDTITVTPSDTGSTVVHRADLTFTGLARFAGRLLEPLPVRLGDRTAARLASALDRR